MIYRRELAVWLCFLPTFMIRLLVAFHMLIILPIETFVIPMLTHFTAKQVFLRSFNESWEILTGKIQNLEDFLAGKKEDSK